MATPNRRARRVLGTLIGVTLLFVGMPSAEAQHDGVRINEIMAANTVTIADADGDHPDWVELHNASATTADLSGWVLADKPSNAPDAFASGWTLPTGTTIPANGFVVVFASGKNRTGDELHTDFALNSNGESVTLFDPSGDVVSSFDELPQLKDDVSLGISATGDTSFFTEPTPGHANGSGGIGFLAPVTATPGRGIYLDPVAVTLSADAGATIRYTTDRSEPTLVNGSTYQGPISISGSTTLRVAVFKPDHQSPPVVSYSYLFPEDVRDAHATTSVTLAEYETGLRALPTVSLTGSYSSTRGQVDVEWIDPSGGPEFHITAGAERVGNTSKLSTRLYFEDDYGESRLEFDLYDGFESGLEPADSFKRLNLRRFNHEAGFSARSAFIRNRWSDESMLDLGLVASHGRFAHIYINGAYQGLTHVREQFDDHFAASYYGGDNRDYTNVNGGSGSAGTSYRDVAGSYTSWESFTTHVDEVAYADYLALTVIAVTSDLLKDHNWRAIGPLSPRSDHPGWTFITSDADLSLKFVVQETFGSNGRVYANPSELTDNLLARSEEFRVLLADRVYRHLFEGGELTAERNIARWNRVAAQMRPGVLPHLAYKDKSWLVSTTHENLWEERIDWAATEILSHQTDAAYTAMTNQDWITDLVPPQPSEGLKDDHYLAAGSAISLTNPNGAGTIYYTVDGSDPRQVGGAVGPTAQTYSTPISIPRSTVLNARVLDGQEWSPIRSVRYLLAPDASVDFGALTVSELNYNPAGPDTEAPTRLEFIELMNTGATPVNVAYLRFTDGIDYTFPPDSVIGPGQRVVVAKNLDDFKIAYPTVDDSSIYGPFSGKLDNGGETITLSNGPTPVVSFTYSDTDPWPTSTDGGGYSLVVPEPDPATDLSQPDSWGASLVSGGTPARPDAVAGDADNSGAIDQADLIAMLEYLVELKPLAGNGDLNRDGLVTLDDARILARALPADS